MGQSAYNNSAHTVKKENQRRCQKSKERKTAVRKTLEWFNCHPNSVSLQAWKRAYSKIPQWHYVICKDLLAELLSCTDYVIKVEMINNYVNKFLCNPKKTDLAPYSKQYFSESHTLTHTTLTCRQWENNHFVGVYCNWYSPKNARFGAW